MQMQHAMVLAAGLGTRLRPLTDTLPKPLVAVGGRPMIDYVLDLLEASGITTAVVNVHHLADLMQAHLASRPSPRILISDERSELLNSGGGLARGLKLLPEGPVLVMNADLFWIGEPAGTPANLKRLMDLFDPATMDMAMLCVRLEDTTGHNGTTDFSLADDGRLVRIRDRQDNPVVYAGALVLNSTLLDDAPEGAFNLNIYFDRAIAAGRLFGLVLEGHWITVGTPDALGDAEDVLRRAAAP